MFRRSILMTIGIIILVAAFKAITGPSERFLSQNNEENKKTKTNKVIFDKKTHPGDTLVNPVFLIVLDDFGYSMNNLKKLKDLGIDLTIAVLPNAPFTGDVCSFAERNGLEAILHMPMEPEGDTQFIEEGTLSASMTGDVMMNFTDKAFDSVFCAKGVSNHMGSKATQDETVVTVLMDKIKKNRMYFLDSFTTRDSVCEKIASSKKIPFLKRDIFIDNEPDKEYIKNRLLEAERISRKKGYVVVLGHDRKNTIEVLSEMVPPLKDRGIKFLTISQFINNRRTEQ